MELYAKAYAHLLHGKSFPETFYILGVGHQCPHEFSAVPCNYETPLGRLNSDQPLMETIERDCGFDIALSPATYKHEHSLEFVVIWLQALRDLYFPQARFKIVPILMGGLFETVLSGKLPGPNHEITRFGKAVAGNFRQHVKGEAAIIASIDGCHVGPRFDHDFPANATAQKMVRQWEKELWEFCRSDKLDDFILHLHRVENAFYFDGVGVLTLLLRNFALSARRETHELWYEESDQSFVTFSGGYFSPLTRNVTSL
jgi:AmmeMemoRadiSam system protein B